MKRTLSLAGSSIGKKVLMGASGVLLLGFVVGHMVGNLKIYQGETKYNAYAEFLREFGHPILGPEQFLWIARLGLLAAIGIHIVAAYQVVAASHRARRHAYRKKDDLSFSYASRTMRWGGVIVLLFVVYHLLHLTTGTVHGNFEYGSVYANVVYAFSKWPIALFYIACMIPLGMHIYHGAWSATQTLGVDGPRVVRYRRAVAATVALAVTVGNISIPVAVLAGWVG